MTRDTKIGLLLGLVFIFIIAFLINGLPRLRGRNQNTPSRVTRTPIASPGIGARERLVGQNLGGPVFPTTATSPAGQPQPANTEIRSITPLPGTQQVGQTNPPVGAPAAVAGSGVPASGQTLVSPASASGPAAAGAPAGGVMPASSTATVPVRSLATGPAPQTGAALQPAVAGALTPEQSTLPSPSGSTGPMQNPATTGPQTARGTQQGVQTAKAAVGEWPKTYKVVKGDSLEAIAKRMYGASEGVKPASIKRIFEANKSILKSPEELNVGQQLTIPAPIGGGAVAPTPAVALDSQKASTPAKPAAAAAKPAVATAKSSEAQAQRWYTVKEGDTLWKIATSQLGKGTRYQEIAKLNVSTLKSSEDNLEAGMKLRLPAK